MATIDTSKRVLIDALGISEEREVELYKACENVLREMAKEMSPHEMWYNHFPTIIDKCLKFGNSSNEDAFLLIQLGANMMIETTPGAKTLVLKDRLVKLTMEAILKRAAKA